MSTPWAAGLRRGVVPLVLGLLCLVLAWPAIEDLDRLLKGLGVLLLILGGIIVLATVRTAAAEEKRVSAR